jgi:glycerol uptake facilitator-like aquaporin
LLSYIDLTSERILTLKPASVDYSRWNVFYIEILGTFIFVSSILHNVYPRLSIQSDAVLATGSVAVSLYFSILISVNYSGGALNPTFAIVNILFVSYVKDSTYLKFLPSYICGTLLGGILSGVVCKYLVMPAIPPYYDNLLNVYKDDIQSRLSMVDSIVERKQNYLPAQ